MKKLGVVLLGTLLLARCNNADLEKEKIKEEIKNEIINEIQSETTNQAAETEGTSESDEVVEKMTKEEVIEKINSIIAEVELNEYIDRIESFAKTVDNPGTPVYDRYEVRIFTSFDEYTLSAFNITLTKEEFNTIYETMTYYCNDILNSIVEQVPGEKIDVIYSNEKSETQNPYYPSIVNLSVRDGVKSIVQGMDKKYYETFSEEMNVIDVEDLK